MGLEIIPLGTYSLKGSCTNCGSSETGNFTRGTRARDNAECSRCGCYAVIWDRRLFPAGRKVRWL